MNKPSRIYLSPPHMSGNELDFVKEVFDANWIAPVGPQLDEFENRFARRIGVDNAVAVSSGTAALHLILRHLGVTTGDEVITSSFTFCASANPITYDGARPVFIDSDRVSWNLDPNLLEDELKDCERRNQIPKAILAVDILGQSADMDAINELASRYDIPVIEDAAEALGSTYKGRPAGASAWASVFSFNGNKIITTSGGGMICTNDAKLAQHARYLATQARDPAPYYLHSEIGFNYRLSNVLAAIGLGQLEALDRRVETRRRIRGYYASALCQLEGISFMPEASYSHSNCWLSTVQIDPATFGRSCEEVRVAMEENNIEARRVWKPLHTQPVFSNCRCRGGDVSEQIFSTALSLPSGTALSDEQLDRIIDVFRQA